MSYKVKKAAVLGSGVMGSGIACHLANVGIDVLMLDIQPKDKSTKNKNIIAEESLKNAIKSRPNPLYKKEYAKRISTGNFEDDFEKIKANPNLTVIGHMTDKSDSANLVTRGDEVIPLKAQGWKAF